MEAENIPLKIQNWLNQINHTTERFKTLFGTLTEKELNWKPNKQTWSIAQNMDHLIVINESYFPILEALHKGAYKTPFLGKLRFITKLMGNAMLTAVNPDRKKKIETFEIWEPRSGEKITDILKEFESHQEKFKQQIKRSADILEKGTIIASPASKNIVYPLQTAFEILITHEKRHLQQAKEVLEIEPEKSLATNNLIMRK